MATTESSQGDEKDETVASPIAGTRTDQNLASAQNEGPTEEDKDRVGSKNAESEDDDNEYNEDRELYHNREPQKFNPKLYTFRFPLKVQPKQTYSVLAPPFWVLVDHLLAVVWHLYCGESTEKVGVVHLQWALEFSRWIKDESGTIPKAVKSLILVIEDALMEKYTNLSKIKPQQSQLNGSSLTEKDDKLNTSVTLNDILSRTPGITTEKALLKSGKKTLMSKASGPASGHSPEKSTGEPVENMTGANISDVVKLLNILKMNQEERVQNEKLFLDEIETALKNFNESDGGDLSKLLNRLQNKKSSSN